MAKEIVLGNENLILTYDSNLCIRDIYFPHIGEENHLEEDKNRIGFWIGGKFSWVDEEWKKNIKYMKDSLVADISASTEYLNIKIKEKSTVHYKKNIFLREIEVENLNKEDKEIIVFFHHNLKLYGKNKNNTGLYDPITKGIIQYKKRRYFIFNGMVDGQSMYEYNIENITLGEGYNYKDAEDGKLEMNSIAQGRINSLFSLKTVIKGNSKKVFYYWLGAGKNFEDMRELNNFILSKGVESLINETDNFWKNFINKRELNFSDLDYKFKELFKISIMIIKSHVNENGALISSVDYEHVQFNRDTYNYVWPREAALGAMALDKAGYTEISRRIFKFLSGLITKGGFFWNKYHANGSMASNWHPWAVKGELQLPIQEDQTAMLLIALYKHYKISKDMKFIEDIYDVLIEPAVGFLVEYISEETKMPFSCYDIWEEKKGIHFYTIASIYEALIVSKEFIEIFDRDGLKDKIDKSINYLNNLIEKFWFEEEKRFVITITEDENTECKKDLKYDSSILLTLLFDNFYDKYKDRLLLTSGKTVDELWIKSEIGGMARFKNDRYHQLTRDIKNIPGNPWIYTTLLAGFYYLKIDNFEKVKEIFDWVEDKALDSGILAEQVHPHTGESISIAPYVLSHSMYILLINEYVKKTGKKLII